MGTNWYLFNTRAGQEAGFEGMHIGKRSCGWVFHFQAYPELNIRTVKDWKFHTKMGFIYDEYGDEYTYDKFWKIVEETKEPDDGMQPTILYYPENNDRNWWEDEGFSFSSYEFC